MFLNHKDTEPISYVLVVQLFTGIKILPILSFRKLEKNYAMQSYVLMLQTDVDDRDITEAMLSGIDLVIPVKFLDNMDELASFVTEQGQPALILISENEKHTGIEIIRRLKNNSFYKHIPLVILAERSLSEYVKECYAAGASTVIIKPSTLELTKKKIENFFDYWFKVAELPLESTVESINTGSS